MTARERQAIPKVAAITARAGRHLSHSAALTIEAVEQPGHFGRIASALALCHYVAAALIEARGPTTPIYVERTGLGGRVVVEDARADAVDFVVFMALPDLARRFEDAGVRW